ncbi:MAG: MacB family efflux pump subunit [Hyphomicrobiales bacterium]|nr:MAG: MacB family efflux pump subunit [Hyphomicrobiales bacterium]
MAQPLISLRGLTRRFVTGAETVTVLRDVNLDIHPGEMIAIIGQSGSGKSTLMNILGCLDRASEGTYFFAGRDISRLGPDELAELRREHFGFIFQRYQLLGDLSAVENAAVPAIYAGIDGSTRNARATQLLQRLGLGDRLRNRPAALSGGQQQRVSVARALMNGGEVILADEPTGALDSRSGAELMALLKELHAEGHTIIIVTHDANVAQQAERIIEIRDGEIIADKANADARRGDRRPAEQKRRFRAGKWLDDAGEALRMSLRAMVAHKLRTFLTMLGIIIGIASVVSVVALGQGSQQTVLENIASIGTNTINVYPGTGFGDRGSGRIRTLIASDAEAIAREPYADSVTPRVSTNSSVLFGSVSANAQISGVGQNYFRVSGSTVTSGSSFDTSAINDRAQVAVIDTNAVTALFKNGENPIGQIIQVGKVPARVIGVVAITSTFGPGSSNPSIYLPYTTVMDRILGQNYLSQITVRIADSADMDTAQAEIGALLTRLHGTTDFFLQNTNTIRETIQSTSQTLTLLISAIAVISLVVGGIGVMNIMLVSVSERTREIGIRMAVGARRGDIMRQFLTEAVLVCIVGGAAGVALSFVLGYGLTQLMAGARLSYSAASIFAALASSTLIGIVFGFMPARSAARLDPVQALARE